MERSVRFPWIGVSAVAAFVLLGIVLALPIPEEVRRDERPGNLPAMGLTRISPDQATELLNEEIGAYDPAPLFIPSKMNSSDPELPEGIRPGAKGPFAELPPLYVRNAPLLFPAGVSLPDGPVEELKRTVLVKGMVAMGLVDLEKGEGAKPAIRLEVLRVGSGEQVLAIDIPLVSGLGDGDWQPLELVGAVSREGLVGDLGVALSSGSNEIDNDFRSHLHQNMLIGDRLPKGFYTFRVGR